MKILTYLCTLLFLFTFRLDGYAQKDTVSQETFIDGIRLYNLDDYKGAIEILKKFPDNDAAAFYMGLSYFNLKDLETGEILIKKALELDPGNYWYRIKLAQLYHQTKRTEQAIALYENLKKDFPKKSSLYYEIIELYTQDGQIDKAIKTLDQIEAIGGVNTATLHARFDLLRMRGDYEGAVKYLLQLETMVDSPQISYMVGDYYKTKYQDQKAISYYNKALSIDNGYVPANFGLAEIYRTRRNMPQYFKNIDIFLSSKDMSPQMKAQYMKEVVLIPDFVQTFPYQVDTMVQHVIRTHPEDSSAIDMAAEYYMRSGKQDQAAACYKLNAELYPDHLPFTMTYISLLYFMEDWKGMISVSRDALKRFPDDPSLYESIAVSYWQLNQPDSAIAVYEKIVETSPRGSDAQLMAYASLGDLHHLKGKMTKAFSYYDKALKINPDYIPVLNNYAYYLSTLNKSLDKALEMSKKTVIAEPDNPTYLDTYAWILYLKGQYEEAKKNFKHAMIYGGKESAVILDHYADTLYQLKEYDLAFIYWEQAHKLDPAMGIDQKIEKYKSLPRAK